MKQTLIENRTTSYFFYDLVRLQRLWFRAIAPPIFVHVNEPATLIIYIDMGVWYIEKRNSISAIVTHHSRPGECRQKVLHPLGELNVVGMNDPSGYGCLTSVSVLEQQRHNTRQRMTAPFYTIEIKTIHQGGVFVHQKNQKTSSWITVIAEDVGIAGEIQAVLGRDDIQTL